MDEEQMAAAQARLDAIEPGQWWSDDAADVYAANLSDPEDPYFILGSCNSSSKRFTENATFIAHAPDDLRAALAALRRIWAVYLDDESGGCWDVVDRWVLIRALTDCEPSVSRGVVYPDPTENKYKHEHTLRLDKKYWMCICGYSILADLEGADTNG